MKARIRNQKEFVSHLFEAAGQINLPIRLVALFLITALLMPLIYFGGGRKVSAEANSSIANKSAPVSAPPEPFVFSSSSSENSTTATALSSIASINHSLSDSYQSISDSLRSPELPEGFANAKLPTLWNKVSRLLSSDVIAIPVAASTGVGKYDFDADSKADVARWQSTSGEWKSKNSSNGNLSTVTLAASSTTVIAPADYDGDGKTDRAVLDYSTGTWTIKRSSDGATQTVTGLGQAGDKVVSGKYDGDGLADEAVYRPSNGTWYVKQSSTGTIVSTAFGASTDIPAPGDYDGDGKMDYAVFRPSTGYWHFLLSGSGYAYSYFQWGISTDTPVPADYDGDGKTDCAVYRSSTGTWYVNNSNGTPYTWKTWGNYGDQPVAADYDGDGKDDFAVWRPTTGVWYIVKSSDATLNTYDYQTLGAAGDVPVESAYVKQIGGPVSSYGLAKARLAPINATGGTNLYSRNFSWGTSLVGLPGRAGLDAGFGISYNSLVWTKQFGTMIFDSDNSNVSPGFRFGFPVIEPNYFDSVTGKFAYLMVTPSGSRIEFRQDAASGLYYTADSSYTQLAAIRPPGVNQPIENYTLTVTTTDGAMMTYVWKAGAFRCSQIEDRNGNYITINHDQYGLLQSVTDTLGRVININYDSQQYPISITQDWKTGNGDGTTVTHTYATFTYANSPAISTSFVDPATSNAIPVYGPPNGTVLKVLSRITSADGSYTTFDYNTYGQVSKVSNYASDAHLLNSARTDLETASSTAQPDCPRFTLTKTYAENFNGGAETVVHNSFAENQSFSVDQLSGTATKVEVTMDNAPHSVMSRTWYYPSGNWAEGLQFATEDFGDGARKRWTTTAWTQDNTSLAYILNPRVTDMKVGDVSNVKRTHTDYCMLPGTNIYLPSETDIYDGVSNALLKQAMISYNTSQDYLDRRIIGLPAESDLKDGNGILMSKTTYAYDGDNFTGTEQDISSGTQAVIQHDNANYGASFTTGRGNLTSTTRYDALGQSSAITSSVKYNTAGGVVAQITPGATVGTTRTTAISYIDSFNDTTTSRNTYAYPTKLTDPAGNYSQVKYRFDIGANVWAQSPAPQNQTSGKTTTRVFDDIGRLQKESLWKYMQGSLQEYAYTRFDYQQTDRDVHSKVYSTVTDTNNSGAGDTADEVLTEAYTDGAGRVIKSRTPLTFDTYGNTATWTGQKTVYNILGQVSQQSVPTEVDASWNPAGDDYSRGFLWTQNEYDWKGRVTRTVNTDGTDKIFSYDGCGCAGGQIMTVQGEEIEPNKRQTQKVYADVLGREYKTEILDWQQNVYKTIVNSYNGRDQIISNRVYAGTGNSNNFRETISNYDGFGRLQSQHTPEQDANKYTTYTYFADDKPESVTDARGATKHYQYDDQYGNRGLVHQISWSRLAGSDIEIPATVTFGYDNAGNRIQMNDGFGSVNYEYDSLSQLTAETRQFNETVPTAPLPNNGFRIEYSYGLSGKLTSYKEPFGEIVSYGFDKTGKIKTVSGYQTVENVQLNYITDASYRAWGAVKSLNYGNNNYITMHYNNRLQAQDYTLGNAVQQYQYYSDGRLKFSSNSGNSIFNRSYEYDFLGRLTVAKTGAEASGQPENNPNFRPYRMTLGYNQFGDITNQERLHWSASFSSTFQYENGRETNETTVHGIPNWVNSENRYSLQYDADGRMIAGEIEGQKYDAEGRVTVVPDTYTAIKYDGDGGKIKSIGAQEGQTDFYIKSSVLGEDASKIESHPSDGLSRNSRIYANGKQIAERRLRYIGMANIYSDTTFLQTADPSGAEQSEFILHYSGHFPWDFMIGGGKLDPFGAGVGDTNPYPTGTPDPNYPDCDYDFDHRTEDHCEMPGFDDPENEDSQTGSVPQDTCYVNGFKFDCNEVANHPEDYDAEPEFAPADKYKNPTGLFFGNTNVGAANWVEDEDTSSVDPNSNSAKSTVNIQANGHFEFMPAMSSDDPPMIGDLTSGKVHQSEESKKCDEFLAKMFSDPGAVFANLWDPIMGNKSIGGYRGAFSSYDRNGKIITNSAGDHGYAAHLYSDPKASTTANIYVPLGGSKINIIDEHSDPLDAKSEVVNKIGLIFYKQLGSLKNVVLAINHIDPSNPTVVDGRVLVGKTGGIGSGEGGESGTIHSHLELLDASAAGMREFLTHHFLEKQNAIILVFHSQSCVPRS